MDGHGVCSSSGDGDGGYEAFIRTQDGEVTGIRIVFLSDETDDDPEGDLEEETEDDEDSDKGLSQFGDPGDEDDSDSTDA